ncbi:MAG: Na/Pi cotransporter family protein [Clostridia bacterium]|nr:Na/Pi cotransporter family protein [Clostridia bacterium]
MNILISVIKLFGGLALLIYGMKILSTNLKKASGGKLEKILESATDNMFKGLLTGILITVATQSSSATTVIVVGLVNSEILKLKNAIPIIMGANIGTTITSQILRLTSLGSNSWISLFTPEVLAPILIVVGLVIMELAKNRKTTDIGQMIMGVGLLFTGMMSMVSIASGFSEIPILSEILAKLSNPILGVLAGTIITGIVQSSAATVGILQALSTTGIITYATTIPVILGQNIGTCITSILASIGSSKNAKRAAAVHLYFNLIGTIIFLVVIYTYQTFIGFSFWNDIVDMGQIANFHTIFNVISTIILLPFISLIEKLTIITIRDKKKKEDDDDDDESDYLSVLNMLDERVANMPNIAITNSTAVVDKMGEIAEKNFRKSMKLLKKFEPRKLEKIEERENAIDKMEQVVTDFLVKLGNLDLSDQENINVTTLLKIEDEYEKIGDYAYEFSKIIDDIHEKNTKISEYAYHDLERMYNITEDTILSTIQVFREKDTDTVVEIEALKEFAEMQKEKYKNAHIQRLKEGKCNVESGIAFLEILTVFEKIINHCSNVAIATLNYMTNENFVTKQEFFNKIYETKSEILKNKLNECNHKYAI